MPEFPLEVVVSVGPRWTTQPSCREEGYECANGHATETLQPHRTARVEDCGVKPETKGRATKCNQRADESEVIEMELSSVTVTARDRIKFGLRHGAGQSGPSRIVHLLMLPAHTAPDATFTLSH